MKNTNKANLKHVKQVLGDGGRLVFEHSTCKHWIVSKDGSEVVPVDGRTYHAFVCNKHQSEYVRTDTNSIATNNLIITWRAK